ncbi:MAG: cytochrome c family protein [Pseudomonadota bacterium]
MDSNEFNKVFAAVLTAGLVAMMASFISRKIVHPEKPTETALAIDGVEAAVIDAGPTGPEPILAMLSTADVSAGEALSRACVACHSFNQGGPNKVGPNLYDIVDASVAHLDNYSYSTAMAEWGGNWTYESLNKFFYKPREYMPGTKMNYAGLRDAEDRANLIAYLRTLAASPAALPDEARIAADKVDLGFTEVAEEAEEAAGDAMDEATDAASNAARDAMEAVEDAAETADQAIQEGVTEAGQTVGLEGEEDEVLNPAIRDPAGSDPDAIPSRANQ